MSVRPWVEHRKDRTAIHITDVRQFKNCRQWWDFSSPLRMNLESKNPNKNLLTGSLVHEALAEAYSSGVFDGEQLVSKYETSALERVKAINESSFGEELSDSLISEIALGFEVIKHYALWAPKFDEDAKGEHPQLSIAEVFATEVRLEVPMPTVPGVYLYYEGTADGIVRLRNGDISVLEHKTCSRYPESDTLYIDEQMLGYLWAANADQTIADECRPTTVLYNFLLKKAPATPERLLNGSFAQRKNAQTSFEHYKAFLLRNNSDPSDYAEYLYSLYQNGNQFFKRVHITKRPQALAAFSRRLVDTVVDMVDPDVRIYPSPAWYKCSWCPFLEPCRLLQDGINPQPTLRFSYQKREPRWADRSIDEE